MGEGKHGTLLSIIDDFDYLLGNLSRDKEDILALENLLTRLRKFNEIYIESEWV